MTLPPLRGSLLAQASSLCATVAPQHPVSGSLKLVKRSAVRRERVLIVRDAQREAARQAIHRCPPGGEVRHDELLGKIFFGVPPIDEASNDDRNTRHIESGYR